MRKNKSPWPGEARGKKQENKERVGSLYPSEPPVVKGNSCRDCRYFRAIPRARFSRMFCALTGESVTESWDCEFFTAGGGA